jgi:hypothetical protein
MALFVIENGISEIQRVDPVRVLEVLHVIGDIVRGPISDRMAFKGRIGTIGAVVRAAALCHHIHHAASLRIELYQARLPKRVRCHAIQGSVRVAAHRYSGYRPSFDEFIDKAADNVFTLPDNAVISSKVVQDLFRHDRKSRPADNDGGFRCLPDDLH